MDRHLSEGRFVFVFVLAAILGLHPVPVFNVPHPTVKPAQVGAPLRYRALVKRAPEDDTVATVNGRRRWFRPANDGEKVRVQAVGRDGTILLYRSYYGLYSSFSHSIVHGKSEVVVNAYGHQASVDEYRGAHDFAGSFFENDSENGNDAQPPSTPPVAFVVEKGRYRIVGRGKVIAWEPGGTVATKVNVDAGGQPAGYDNWMSTHIQVLEKGRMFDLGELDYVGRLGKGFVFADANGSVFVWRDGRLSAWARLPKGWVARETNGRSTLLARRNDPDDTYWNWGLLRGNVFRELRFSRPARTIELRPDTPLSVRSDGRLRFEAYEGEESTRYEVTLGPVG